VRSSSARNETLTKPDANTNTKWGARGILLIIIIIIIVVVVVVVIIIIIIIIMV
jgi:flagellar basal body-associated protein FliL